MLEKIVVLYSDWSMMTNESREQADYGLRNYQGCQKIWFQPVPHSAGFFRIVYLTIISVLCSPLGGPDPRYPPVTARQHLGQSETEKDGNLGLHLFFAL